jgi:hypothetical protein
MGGRGLALVAEVFHIRIALFAGHFDQTSTEEGKS